MRAMTKILAGGVVAAALFGAAPAVAQYYPGSGYPGYGYPGYGYGYGGNVVGQVVNQVLGGGYGYNGYGYANGGSRIAVSQCSAAVQQRIGGGYGYGYNNGGYGGGRVLGINSVEIRSNGGYKVRGIATRGAYGGYGGYGGYGQGNVGFTCRTDYRGMVNEVRFDNNYGYNYNNNYGYQNYGYQDPYSAYGYRRY
jgi:hypothetical protein